MLKMIREGIPPFPGYTPLSAGGAELYVVPWHLRWSLLFKGLQTTRKSRDLSQVHKHLSGEHLHGQIYCPFRKQQQDLQEIHKKIISESVLPLEASELSPFGSVFDVS